MLAVAGALMLWAPVAMAADGSPGITKPFVLPAYNQDAPACTVPTGLTRALGYVQENDRDFLEGANQGLAAAAKDRGLPYQRVLADSDAQKASAEIQAMIAAKTGAIIATSSNPDVVAHDIQEAIWAGAFVGTIVPPPATLILNAPQYATGKVLADAAIDYINTKLGGKATVVLLTQDSMQFLAPRFEAMRRELSQLPGVTIVADIAPNPVTEGGRLRDDEHHSFGDAECGRGARRGLRWCSGRCRLCARRDKDRPDQFLGGIDGEPEAVAEIKKGDGPYKASIALSSAVFGYAMGQAAADWLDGKSVPQAMDALPIALSKDNLAQYEADQTNPGPVYADPTRRDTYIKRYGNICYDTRDQYLNFPWSSEAR